MKQEDNAYTAPASGTGTNPKSTAMDSASHAHTITLQSQAGLCSQSNRKCRCHLSHQPPHSLPKPCGYIIQQFYSGVHTLVKIVMFVQKLQDMDFSTILKYINIQEGITDLFTIIIGIVSLIILKRTLDNQSAQNNEFRKAQKLQNEFQKTKEFNETYRYLTESYLNFCHTIGELKMKAILETKPKFFLKDAELQLIKRAETYVWEIYNLNDTYSKFDNCKNKIVILIGIYIHEIELVYKYADMIMEDENSINKVATIINIHFLSQKIIEKYYGEEIEVIKQKWEISN